VISHMDVTISVHFFVCPKKRTKEKAPRHLSALSGFLRLYMKNGRDVAASSHFLYLLRQLLHALLYLLHPCSRRQSVERGGRSFSTRGGVAAEHRETVSEGGYARRSGRSNKHGCLLRMNRTKKATRRSPFKSEELKTYLRPLRNAITLSAFAPFSFCGGILVLPPAAFATPLEFSSHALSASSVHTPPAAF